MWPRVLWIKPDSSDDLTQLCEANKPESRNRPTGNRKQRLRWIILFIMTAIVLTYMLHYLKNVDEPRLYRTQFEAFKKKFDRHYSSAIEEKWRYKIFAIYMRQLETEKREYTGDMELDVTQFADHTEDELKAIFSPALTGNEEMLMSRRYFRLDDFERPESKDWRDAGIITPVKDQSRHPTCLSFGVTASVEALYAMRTNETLSLSEQSLIDCCLKNTTEVFEWIKEHGLVEESTYPAYTGVKQSCRVHDGSSANMTKRFRIDGYSWLPNDENFIAKWVAANGPVTLAGFYITHAFLSYKTGIYPVHEKKCQSPLGFHAVAIVGYGVDGNRPFWWVKNSWGVNWGMNGYFKMARGRNVCRMAEKVIAPILH